jgi:hypothetical protein
MLGAGEDTSCCHQHPGKKIIENVGDTWETKRRKKAGNKMGEGDPYIV